MVPLSAFVREHKRRERAGHAQPREWRVRPAAGFMSVAGHDSCGVYAPGVAVRGWDACAVELCCPLQIVNTGRLALGADWIV